MPKRPAQVKTKFSPLKQIIPIFCNELLGLIGLLQKSRAFTPFVLELRPRLVLPGDIDWSGIQGSVTAIELNCPATCSTKNTWLGTARGGIGYAWDRVLLFATGGAAFGDIKGQVTGTRGVSQSKAVWTAGGGVGYGVNKNLSVKTEYLYVNLGSVDCGANCGAPAPDVITLNNVNILRGGVNYRF